MILVRCCQLMVEALKQVIIWGQRRRLSFDMSQQEAYYKTPPTITAPAPREKDKDKAEPEPEPYQRMQTQEQIVRMSLDLDSGPNSKLYNCYKPVMDYKDISKMLIMMQGVVMQAKQKVYHTTVKYMNYSFLWKEDKELEAAAIMDEDPVITEIQAIWRSYTELEHDILEINKTHRAGPLEMSTEELKQGLLVEVKAWKNCLCRHINERYKARALNIAKFIDEANKDLAGPTKDMNEIGFIMTVLSRVRHGYVTHDRLITPIEEAYVSCTIIKQPGVSGEIVLFFRIFSESTATEFQKKSPAVLKPFV